MVAKLVFEVSGHLGFSGYAGFSLGLGAWFAEPRFGFGCIRAKGAFLFHLGFLPPEETPGKEGASKRWFCRKRLFLRLLLAWRMPLAQSRQNRRLPLPLKSRIS